MTPIYDLWTDIVRLVAVLGVTALAIPVLVSHRSATYAYTVPGITGIALASLLAGDREHLVLFVLASKGGMEAVMGATSWAEHFAKNPASREKIRTMDPDKFIAVMQKWASAYVPSDISPVPGMKPIDFARLTMPTVVFKSHKCDLSHTETTSLWVHRLIPQSKLVLPPWRDDEWNYQSGITAKGEQHTLFTSWPKLVPVLLDLAAQ